MRIRSLCLDRMHLIKRFGVGVRAFDQLLFDCQVIKDLLNVICNNFDLGRSNIIVPSLHTTSTIVLLVILVL